MRLAERGSMGGKPAKNSALVRFQRVEKSASGGGRVQMQHRWSGSTAIAATQKGRSSCTRRKAMRNRSMCAVSRPVL
jgi:hypothetical protein